MDIFDFSLYIPSLDHFPTYEEIIEKYPDKMVEKNGVHFIRVEPSGGRLRKREEITNDIKVGKFLAKEYIITEFDQILPLYGLTFKRNEYLIVWRDPHFLRANDYYEFLEKNKLFIYENTQFNIYCENYIEKALELIDRKKYNKIILISNIGLDLSGKRFVEIARKILGFNVIILFLSNNKTHLSLLQNFPNALFSDNIDFFKHYVLNYNEEGLINLKKKIEKYYNIKLNFDKDFLQFPKFINEGKYSDLIFEERTSCFRKIIIRNSKNKSIFCMDNEKMPYFNSNIKTDCSLYIWYVTIIGNTITLFSNGRYLGANIYTKSVTGEKYMKIYKLEKINDNEYLIYYDNKDNILTVKGNKAILERENNDRANQKFKFIDIFD